MPIFLAINKTGESKDDDSTPKGESLDWGEEEAAVGKDAKEPNAKHIYDVLYNLTSETLVHENKWMQVIAQIQYL